MSTRYNTGNPIESTDVRDMSDNAKNFDEFVNSNNGTFKDRFGIPRLTLDGFIKQYGINPASFDFQSGGTLNAGDNNLGVLWPSSFGGDGDYYIWKGTYPKSVPAASSPESTGGISKYGWLPLGDITLRHDLASKDGHSLIGGDLSSYGADASGAIACDTFFDAMIADNRFVVSSGRYLIEETHTIDISLLKEVSVGTDVEFILRSNVDGLVFKNAVADFNANGLRITVDIDGGGYSGTALTLRGTKYFTPPQNLGRLTQKTKFGPFYVFNRNGASKQEVASSPVMDEGYGFSIDCNSQDEEILVWNSIDVASTGFSVAHAIGVGTNPLNFISSLDLNLIAWFSTYHFRDGSTPAAAGNVSAGIGDVNVRLQSQPHPQMVKVVHMEHAPGYMSGCRFELSIWDANVFGFTPGVVDASQLNEYSNTLERRSYPLTRALNTVDGSLFPIVNYYSSIQESDVLVSSDPELAKYLYLSEVSPDMSVIEACNSIKNWCNQNNIRHSFEFKIYLGDSTTDIRNVFLPWLTSIGDSSGFLTMKASYYNGIINTINVLYEVDTISNSENIERHGILWTSKSGMVSHQLLEYSRGTTSEIKSKASIQKKGFNTFDTTFNLPVWYSGANSWLQADGSVAYTL